MFDDLLLNHFDLKTIKKHRGNPINSFFSCIKLQKILPNSFMFLAFKLLKRRASTLKHNTNLVGKCSYCFTLHNQFALEEVGLPPFAQLGIPRLGGVVIVNIVLMSFNFV